MRDINYSVYDKLDKADAGAAIPRQNGAIIMKCAYTTQIDRIAEERGLGQRGSEYPANTPLVYSVAVYDAPDDVTIYQTQCRPVMLQAVKEAAKVQKQFCVYRRPLQAEGRA